MLLEHGIRPALRRRRLFDGVAESDFGIGRQRVAHQQIGIRLPFVAEHFDAVVHAAGPIPAALDHADRSGREFNDREGFVLTLGAIPMHLRCHLRVDALDLRLAEEPPAEGDAVTSQVHDGAAS